MAGPPGFGFSDKGFSREIAQQESWRRAPLEKGRNWLVEGHTFYLFYFNPKREIGGRSSFSSTGHAVFEISPLAVNLLAGMAYRFLGTPEEDSSELEVCSDPCIDGGRNHGLGRATGVEGH
jgi:hypothetical protein